MDVNLSSIADVVTLISGFMTILGIGGLISWSFFKVERGSLAENSISVLAFSLKTGFCLLILGLFIVPYGLMHIMIVLAFGPSMLSPGEGKMLWDPSYPIVYLASHFTSTLVWLPLYLITCGCIYSGSMHPFTIFLAALKRQGIRGSLRRLDEPGESAPNPGPQADG